MNDAETLRDLELRIPAEALHPLEPGAYYVHDLEGCEVRTAVGQRDRPRGARPVWRGRRRCWWWAGQGEVLVPLVDAICRRVDPAAKRIVIDPPEGLLELNVRSGAAGKTGDD